MNGKKSKMFRALAGVNKETRQNVSYHGVQSTVKVKEILHPTDIDEHGNPVVLGRYQTASYALNQGARLLNKMLKRAYLTKLRNPSQNMLLA